MFRMSEGKNNTNFNAMNVAELKKIFTGMQSFGKQVFQNLTCGNRLCSRNNGFASGPKL